MRPRRFVFSVLALGAALGVGCAVPPSLAPRLAEPSGLERVWIETFGLE